MTNLQNVFGAASNSADVFLIPNLHQVPTLWARLQARWEVPSWTPQHRHAFTAPVMLPCDCIHHLPLLWSRDWPRKAEYLSHRCSTFYHCTELLVGLKVSKMSGESGRGHRRMVLRREESESKGFTRQALLCSRFLSSVVSAEQRWWTPEFQEFAFVFCFVLLSLVASLITGQLQHL